MDVDLKILSELSENNNTVKFEEDTLKITRGAIEKAMLYAKLCAKVANTGMECYGYLLMPKDSLDGTITDVYFADEQLVREAYVRVTDTAVYNASKIMEPRGYQIVGWWHSHGSFNPFHSGTDVENFETVLQSVAPRTMYRNKELLYVIDDKMNELKFDTFVMKGVDTAGITKGKLKIIKKEEGKPYAYSMVVNMNADYYLERISKTFNQEKEQYDVDYPIRPKLVVVDQEDDLEFLVSEIEKDVHRKLIFPEHNGAAKDNLCPDWESMNRIHGNNIDSSSDNFYEGFADKYQGPVKSFVESAKNYLLKNSGSKYARTLLSFLISEGTNYRYDILKENSGTPLTDDEKNALEEKLSDTDKLTENILAALSDTDPKKYFDKSKNMDINQMRNLLVLHFMADTDAGLRDSKNISKLNMDSLIKFYSNKSVALADAFTLAEKNMKALTYYSMERFTDYKNQKNHKYRNIITYMLDKLNIEAPLQIESVLGREIKIPRVNNTKKLFLYPDRKNIFQQMLRDIYEHKLKNMPYFESKFSSRNKFNGKKSDSPYIDFLTGFADIYVAETKGERKIDEFIENKLLSRSGISSKKYSLFQDPPKQLHDYTRRDMQKKREQERGFSFTSKRFTYGSDDSDYGTYRSTGKIVTNTPVEKSNLSVRANGKVVGEDKNFDQQKKDDLLKSNSTNNSIANNTVGVGDALKNLEEGVRKELEMRTPRKDAGKEIKELEEKEKQEAEEKNKKKEEEKKALEERKKNNKSVFDRTMDRIERTIEYFFR